MSAVDYNCNCQIQINQIDPFFYIASIHYPILIRNGKHDYTEILSI